MADGKNDVTSEPVGDGAGPTAGMRLNQRQELAPGWLQERKRERMQERKQQLAFVRRLAFVR